MATKKKADKLDLGANVRRFRGTLGMTMTVLADKVGISQAQVSRLESNQQGFRSATLVRIAEALKVPAWALYMTENERQRAAKVFKVKIA